MSAGWASIGPATLQDDRVLVRPVTEADRAGLHGVAMDPAIWRWFVSLVQTDDDYGRLFDTMLADHAAGTRIVFVIVDKAKDTIAGSMSFGNISERDQRLEIGWSWLGTAFQGTGLNRHAKLALLTHAFDTLGAERVEFKTDQLNVQARRGLRNIGAVEEGTFRSFNPMPGGRRRDAVYYSVIRSEWPTVRALLRGAG
ncbi:MAG: GNAT family N-acetyltransferase [Frankiaceae bacterium]|nr:GNAT family N-acetyltransferase [Frankiaceae bacterium]